MSLIFHLPSGVVVSEGVIARAPEAIRPRRRKVFMEPMLAFPASLGQAFPMRVLLRVGVVFGIVPVSLISSRADDAPQVETLVCLRHGEKPPGGLGQLTVRGLNRALALPDVLARYGKPDFIFAPDPIQKADHETYYYVRPLATIEPTAIRLGMPVQTPFGYRQIAELGDELAKPEYRNALVFVAWEHGFLDTFAKETVKRYGGDASQVSDWPGSDFDSIFLVKITRQDGKATVSFAVEHEGLDHLSDAYPGAPVAP
jgi:hypothetical protein